MQTSFRSGMSSRGGGATGGGPNEQHSSGIDSYGSNGPNQNQLVDVSSYSSSMSQVGIDGQLDPIDRYFERKRAEPNPFVIPDEDIFALREREKAEKAQQRELNMTTKIWDKTSTNPDAIKISQIRETRAKARTTVLGKGGDRPLQPRRRESENMAEFIAKKREMFLIKMSLATKRQEILKLDEKAKLKEKTLRDAERKLEEDALSFDQFLKENDNKAHQAIKAAEDATKRKQDMAQRVKHLRAEVEKVEAEIQKTDMLLRNCEKYKTFLDQRAPPEFREKVERMKQEAEEKRAQRAKMRAIAQLTNSSNNNEGGAMVLHGDGGLVPVSTALTESGSNNALMGMDEEEDDDLDYIPMYFERPDQLLEVFSQLEASNLKLIQAVQEKEGMLEALRQRFSEAKASMFAKSDQLAANIADLKSRVREERARSQGLALREQSYYAGGDQSVCHSTMSYNYLLFLCVYVYMLFVKTNLFIYLFIYLFI